MELLLEEKERAEFEDLWDEKRTILGQVMVKIKVEGRNEEQIDCPKCRSCAQEVIGWMRGDFLVQKFMCRACGTVWQNEFEMLGVPVFRFTCIILGRTQEGITY